MDSSKDVGSLNNDDEDEIRRSLQMEQCRKAKGKKSGDQNHDDGENVGEQAIPRNACD